MILEEHPNGETGDLVRLSRIEGVEPNIRPKGAKGKRKRGGSLLVYESFLHSRMAAIDMDLLTGEKGRDEERKPWIWSCGDAIETDGRRPAIRPFGTHQGVPEIPMPVPASQRMNPSPPPISTQEVFPP